MKILVRNKSILAKLKNQKGSILLISYLVIIVLLGLGAAFMLMATQDIRTAERQRLDAAAFYIAEAGLERAIYDLRQDFLTSPSPSWTDGNINGYAIGPDSDDFYEIPYEETALNGGFYTVSLKNVSGNNSHVWVQSVGTVGDHSKTLQAYVKMINTNIWDHAIFAGSGATGALINGNVDIAGSVLALGDGLNPGDLAMDLGGDAQLVGNNYSLMPSSLASKVPPLPTTLFNGEWIQTLNATLRVQRGIVGLSGSAEVGQPNAAGNAIKETVDGVYVTDGWAGNKGASNVYSDNGTETPYDLGDSMRLPLLSDPALEDPSRSVQQYFKDNALILTNQLNDIKPNSSFSYTDGTNSITMDGSGNMTINGRVYVDGGNILKMSKSGALTTVHYTGKGTLLVTGNVEISINLLTPGNLSFPTNIMGFMTPGDINFTTSQLNAMGMFYSEQKITSEKQTNVVGTFVSNYFDMGNQVPAIFQVPDAGKNLPPGLIGATGGWFIKVASWQVL